MRMVKILSQSVFKFFRRQHNFIMTIFSWILTKWIFAFISFPKIFSQPSVKSNITRFITFPIIMIYSRNIKPSLSSPKTFQSPFILSVTFMRTKFSITFSYLTWESFKIFIANQTLFNHILKNPAFREYESLTNRVINKIMSLVPTNILYSNLFKKSI